MEITPYEAQKKKIEHIARYLNRTFPILDASKTGTGKTYTALWAAKELKLKPFILCPKSTISVWRKAAEELGVELDDVVSYAKIRYGSHARLSTKVDKTILAHNLKEKKTFSCCWTNPLPELVIFDEAHMCSGMTSQLSKIMLRTYWQKIPCLLLTATVADSPLKLKAIGHLLGLHDNMNYYRWIESLGCRWFERRGWKFDTGSRGLKIMRDIHDRLVRENRLVQIYPEDIPNAMNKGIIIPELRDVQLPDTVYYMDVSTQLMEMRELIELAKMQVFIEDAYELLDEGNSVICFVNFHKSVDALRAEFPDAGVITGQQNSRERSETIERFQNNEVRVLIATSGAGGVSINLHDIHGGHPRVSLISPSYNAIEFLQVLGRTVRAGGKSVAIQKIIFASDTIEEQIYRVVKRKVNAIDTITDGELNTFKETNFMVKRESA